MFKENTDFKNGRDCMNRTHCPCSPAYGALMHALPRDASALKRMTDQQIVDQASPWVNRVPPQTEVALHAWAAKAINPKATGLGDLGDLAELSGIGKKLKKAAKKIAKAPLKLAKAQVKIVKKAAKSKIVKKLARPLAYAIGGATGTLALVAKADKIRTAARKVRAKVKAQAQEYGLTADAEQPAPEQPAAQEPVYQEQDQQQQSFAPKQPVAPQYSTQQSFAPKQQQAAPVYQAPQQTFAPAQADPFANFNNVQRLAPADGEQDEQPKIVGLSAAGIIENIKAHPIPWTLGGLGVGFVLYQAMNKPSQRQRAY